MKMYRFVLAVALGLSSVSAMAATQGSLSLTSSSGGFDINLEVPTLVLVTELTDINLGTWDAASPETGSDTFCVYSNQATADVNITVDPGNTGAGSAPVLISATTLDEIPYELDLTGLLGNLLDNIIAAGATASNVNNANGVASSITGFPTPTCTSNFTVSVDILATSMAAVAAADDYTDTVTVTVVPN